MGNQIFGLLVRKHRRGREQFSKQGSQPRRNLCLYSELLTSRFKKLQFFKGTYKALKVLQSLYLPAQNCILEPEINMFYVVAKWLQNLSVVFLYTNLNNSPCSQDVTLTYIKRSEEVLDIFGTSYVCSVYVLCPWGTCLLSPLGRCLFKENNKEIRTLPRKFLYFHYCWCGTSICPISSHFKKTC